jgi:hypothetical protein
MFFNQSMRTLLCLTVSVCLAGCASRRAQTAPAAKAQSPGIVLASGSELLVRIVEPIDVSAAIEGKTWAAVLSRDVRTPEGELLLGAGSPLYLGVASSAGGSHLTMRAVVANGNSYLADVPLVASGSAVTGLEPWGTAATSKDIQLSGSRVFVPGQALIAVKLGQPLTLR